MARPLFLKYVECGHEQPYEPLTLTVCQSCQSGWTEAYYDYQMFKRGLLRGLPGRGFNLWRYCEVLLIESPNNLDLDMVTGGTPLRIPRRYLKSPSSGVEIYIKDERYGPTNSFKGRPVVEVMEDDIGGES